MTRFFVDKVISQSEDVAISLPALWRPLLPSRSRDVASLNLYAILMKVYNHTPMTTSPLPSESITRSILWIRNQKVMLDSDLAKLYGVETKILIRAVKRNRTRFPKDFMFQMTTIEWGNLRYQFGTSGLQGGRRYRPYVFTEQGVAMLSSVLRSSRAISVNIEIMRAFVRLREILSTHKDLARKLEEMEEKYDGQFTVVFDAIRQLMAPPIPENKRRIGFRLL